MDHFKRVCRKCKTVMDQCRCPDPNKKVILDLCNRCKSGQKPATTTLRSSGR